MFSMFPFVCYLYDCMYVCLSASLYLSLFNGQFVLVFVLDQFVCIGKDEIGLLDVPAVLACIPEFVIENICEHILLIRETFFYFMRLPTWFFILWIKAGFGPRSSCYFS